MNAPAPLDVRAQLSGARLLVMGGTGFLGKVWLALVLDRYPDIEHIWLVCRPKKRWTSEQRFWEEVAVSPVFDVLREQYPGAAFEAFLRQKVTPVPGDVTAPFCGIPDDIRDELRGTLTAFVNSSGIVSFMPPLDYALNANAFGMQNLVALAKDLGGDKDPEGLPVLHTSTCYVAGDRTGQVDEVDPLTFPFPKADELEVSHWDPDREIAECVDMVENIRHRSGDAFRQSAFLDQAKKNLRDRNEPTRGSALDAEFKKVKDKYEKELLVQAGTDRAKYWGWHNVYTYTKSIGEQILRRSGVPHTICRPAVIESAVEFPEVGWCEGINTSAPLIYLAMQGPIKYPSRPDTVLDVIPVDQVAIGMTLALAELLEGTSKVVYQLGSSDTSPLKITRFIELIALFKRRYHRNDAPGNPAANWLKSRLEPIAVSVDRYYDKGPRRSSRIVGRLAERVGKLSEGPLTTIAGPVAKQLQGVSKSLEMTANIEDQFVPFMATHNYRFACANTRAAYERLVDDQKPGLHWHPEDIDWRDYILNVHAAGIQRNVSPEIDKKFAREKRPLRTYDHLVQLLEQAADRHELATALLRPHDDGFERVSYRELRAQAEAVAVRLAASGVKPGDRVLLSGKNDPSWVACCFGILRAGAVMVPVAPDVESDKLTHILSSSGAAFGLVDDTAVEEQGEVLDGLQSLRLREACAPGAVGALPEVELTADSLANVLYTSGTTGDPKGVMLTHGNLCAMVASLGSLFPLREDDRLLSVLPLHHAFEFTCGLLLPLSMGARILYLDELTADRLSFGLKEGRITCMVGVPALWQVLERKVRSEVKGKGPLVELAFSQMMNVNRVFGRATGLDLGRLMFGSVHSRFGGNIRVLISGGAALPKDTQNLFSGLGLHLSEGYGLTEASPVLTVSMPKPGGKTGTVGKAVPGVEVQIKDPDDHGVGEVLARGPNVMAGYFGNDDATAQVVDADGWLHTGDLGRLDHKGRLTLVGRAKDVVVAANGENIYLDDVEHSLGTVAYVKELCLCGLPDGRGGEKLGLIAVPDAENHEGVDRVALHAKARDALKEAFEALPSWQRPAVTALVDADLPRTATRKIQRKEVVIILERIVAATPTKARRGAGLSGPVAQAVAGVAGVKPGDISAETHLRDAFGFDSLMFIELAAALENVGTGRPDADQLASCETVGDVVELVGAPPPEVHDAEAEKAEDERIDLPQWFVDPLRKRMADVQRAFNGPGMATRVKGRANIPANRTCIVVSNHSSHLDMGIVKYALGPYGEQLASLAAQDYFFEGNKWKVAWFTYFTNAEPLDRKSGFRASMKQAKQVIEDGKVVLIFPEGTRQPDGQLNEFKPMVGKLALDTGKDILPLWIDGAYSAMPKGAAFPKQRGITVHIGPPLEIGELQRLTDGMKPGRAARRVAWLAHQAVAALQGGSVLRLADLDPSELDDEPRREPTKAEKVEAAVKSLPERFNSERVEREVCWYFSLGDKQGPRWTVHLKKDGVDVKPGRPSGNADCVVKTSEDLFTRLITDAYLPDPTEFISGAIKTNDIPLLIEFSRAFDLSDVSSLGF